METELTKSKQYTLAVYCRLNGVSRDAGIHDECTADTDAQAIATLRRSAEELLSHYDEIGCRIINGNGKTVAAWTLYRESGRSNRDYNHK